MVYTLWFDLIPSQQFVTRILANQQKWFMEVAAAFDGVLVIQGRWCKKSGPYFEHLNPFLLLQR